ncbi:unnamed protein product [Moneuplotes crassus]|uniref:Uncharacterized protein n=1 Tax=Euplotes crassus TaxID=5936 RepID=A0AAD1UEH5_EUPCR|nr:unnamed protein product [Moneuplotes crassus]
MGLFSFKPETKKEVALKWITIPLTMILVMIVGAPVNLPNYYKEAKNPYSDIIRFSSLAGQYLVIIPGFLCKRGIQRCVMEISSIVLALSYCILGSLDKFQIGIIGFDAAIISFACFLANLASTLVIFIAISLCISNYSHEEDLLLPIIIAAHLVTAGEFDENIKHLLFNFNEDFQMSLFFFITGGYVGICSLLLSLTIERRTIKSFLVQWFSPDTFGVTLFVLYCALFIEVLVASQIIEGNYPMTVAVFIIGWLIYLYIPYFFRRIILDQGVKLKGFKMTKVVREVSLSKCLKDSKFQLMCVLSAVIKGTSLTTVHYIKDIGVILRKYHEVEHLEKSYWIVAVSAVFLGGILVVFFRKSIHAYFFLCIAPFLCIFGFYYFLGASYGLISVIIPQIILFGGGHQDFVQTWGFIYLCDLFGIIAMDLIVRAILLWNYQYNLLVYFGVCAFVNLILFIACIRKYCQRKLARKEIKKQKKAKKEKKKKLKETNKNPKKHKNTTPLKPKTKRKKSFNALNLDTSPKLKI